MLDPKKSAVLEQISIRVVARRKSAEEFMNLGPGPLQPQLFFLFRKDE